MNGNLCRCGTYQRIREAMHGAAAALAEGVRRAMNASTPAARRRQFLKSSAALGGGLVIGFVLPAGAAAARSAQAREDGEPFAPNAFVRIGKDGTVTVIVKHLEFGQGVITSLPMILAEELECDWTRVRSELAPAAPEYAHTAFGIQMTGGSSSVWNSWDQLRTAGAQARTMLVAGGRATVEGRCRQTCRAENGVVHAARASAGSPTASSRRPRRSFRCRRT